MMFSFYDWIYKLYLLDIGGIGKDTTMGEAAIKIGGTAAEAVSNFTSYLQDFLLYAGGIIIAIGIMKIIISIQQQDAHAKMQAGLMMALGVAFVSGRAITDFILYKNGTDGEVNSSETMMLNAIDAGATLLRVVSIVLVALGIFQLIMSFINEDPHAKADASKQLSIAAVIGVLGAKSSGAGSSLWWAMYKYINDKKKSGTGAANTALYKELLGWIAGAGKMIGVILIIFGGYNLVMAFKDQDSSQYVKNIVLMVTGAVLACLTPIFSAIGIMPK